MKNALYEEIDRLKQENQHLKTVLQEDNRLLDDLRLLVDKQRATKEQLLEACKEAAAYVHRTSTAVTYGGKSNFEAALRDVIKAAEEVTK